MMKAVAVSKFGATPEVMELPEPQLRPGSLLVRVAAAGINPFDWKMIDGYLDGKMPHNFPLIMGVDGAGVVTAVGDGVSRFKKGDSIYGQFIHSPIGEGSYAEYAIVPESAPITLAPKKIPLEAAAALPTSGMTGQQLLDKLGLQKGQVLLVIGATGGVGSFAVQLAALQGIHVIATAGDDAAAARMQSLGAKEVINYKKAPVAGQIKAAHPEGIDGLIDVVNDQAEFVALTALVKEGGGAFTTRFIADEEDLTKRKLRGGNFETVSTPDALDKLAQLIDDGQLEVPVEHTISLEEVPAAIALSRQGKAQGKTVIKM